MERLKMKKEDINWAMCLACQGRGKKSKGLRKKVKLRYQKALAQFEKAVSEGFVNEGVAPVRPKGHLHTCLNCHGTGLVESASEVLADSRYPHLAIIGGGIGGVALAVACLHRGIPFTLYERDNGFDVRSQGYGLTLQQASRAIAGLGIFTLAEGVVSTRHVVHTTEGKVIGEWGIRKWGTSESKSAPKRTNIHIARQLLRLALLEQLGSDNNSVQWGHQLVDLHSRSGESVNLSFEVDGQIKHATADLVVGADGIRSTVRRLLIGEDASPLCYLGCMVILGICPLENIASLDSTLLDSATVFQTANGHERIYIMPYTSNSVMWQLSFPMPEHEAKALGAKGMKALKEEALRRCQWHEPIPQILAATLESQVSGYPVYDRALLEAELLQKDAQSTLIGDAAHPMSPFKGQGANQALLDALSLARGITKGCRPLSQWREKGVRDSVLTEFEAEMLQRSATKVQDSAEAAQFLHSDIVLHEGNEPRGRCLTRKDKE
jgi:2-polyprenyl-6-methoxyphenol hydroxylase-like FAD-dependent oxidoreductase